MKKITVVGLGYTNIDGLSVKAYRKLFEEDNSQKCVLCRTERHSVAEEFKQRKIPFETLDLFYEESGSFDEMYPEMVKYILSKAEEKEVLLCVPGNPIQGDLLIKLLEENKDVELTTITSNGIAEELGAKAGVISDKAVNVIPAHLFAKSLVNTRCSNIITEVDNQFLASEIKLKLMELYPDDVEVLYFYGHPEIKYNKIQLFAIDRQKIYDFSVNFLILPLDNFAKKLYDIQALLEIMRILRGVDPEDSYESLRFSDKGCSWDREQTHKSIRVNMIEEAYEVVEAINNDDTENLIEELGDMLMQVVFHSEIARESGTFDFNEVVNGVVSKLIRRHPHVFGEQSADSADAAYASWEAVKKLEKKDKAVSASVASLPKDLPPFTKTCKIQKKTSSVGFDFEVSDEAKAFKENFKAMLTKENVGELLFEVADACRELDFSPDMEILDFTEQIIQKFNNWES